MATITAISTDSGSSAADFTIQVRSDDGFALRVRGQAWTAVSGAGYIDPLDPSTIVYETGTGDSNTRGAITLAAGEYDLDFVTWEGGGGAWYEVTSATGTRLNAGEAQWLPLGSTAVVPDINTLNAIHLKTEASVANANIRDRGNVLPAMRNIIETAILAGGDPFSPTQPVSPGALSAVNALCGGDLPPVARASRPR